MNKTQKILTAVLFIILIAVVAEIYLITGTMESREKNYRSAITSLNDSLADLRHRIDSLNLQVPGLGEYMTTVQLHIAKLWFAEKASNWDLSKFELGELNEAFDGCMALHAVRNSVDISAVLQSVQNTQLREVQIAIMKKRGDNFHMIYSQTLAACNSCHRSTGYGFIRIITPTSPPVTNQQWTAVK